MLWTNTLNMLRIPAFLVLGYVLYVNAWVTEDAFITFRSVEHVFAGNGPRWNPHERVQAFTHPLWFLLLCFGRIFVENIYYLAIFLGMLCSLGCMALLLFRKATHFLDIFVITVALIASRAWIDYGTSGLENPLGHFLLLFLFILIGRCQWRKIELVSIYAVASILLLVRHDYLFLILPALLFCFVHSCYRFGFIKSSIMGCYSITPFLLWSGFALVYYGFPFPNTAYAKLYTGLSRDYLLSQANLYFYDSIRRDPVTLLLIAIVALLCLSRMLLKLVKTRFDMDTLKSILFPTVCMIGVATHLFYIWYIGSDYMSGRFFTPAYTLTVFLLVLYLGRWSKALLSVLLLLTFAWPWSIVRSVHSMSLPHDKLVTDEKHYYWYQTSLSRCRHEPRCDALNMIALWPEGDPSWPKPVYARSNVGMNGFRVGVDGILVDYIGLSDSFMARMPLIEERPRIGHYVRYIPKGYLRSIEHGDNRIVSADLALFYESMRSVTQGALWTWERWKNIALLNTGAFNDVVRAVEVPDQDKIIGRNWKKRLEKRYLSGKRPTKQY